MPLFYPGNFYSITVFQNTKKIIRFPKSKKMNKVDYYE